MKTYSDVGDEWFELRQGLDAVGGHLGTGGGTMIDKWFRSVHEAGHGVIAEHLRIPIACISNFEFGATIYAVAERPSQYQNQMRALGGLAAELSIFGKNIDGSMNTIAAGDLENLGMIDQEGRFTCNVLQSNVFQHTLRIVKRKKARLIKIASALMEHGIIDAELNPVCHEELQKLASEMPPEFIGREYILRAIPLSNTRATQ